jgi:hypothetical protein
MTMNILSLVPLLVPLALPHSSAPSQAVPSQSQSAAAASDVRYSTIPPFAAQTISMRLTAGFNHHIEVRGDGSSDLDAYLYDQNGNLVAFDDDSTDLCLLDITPRWTGTFTLVIRNRGSRANFFIATLD